MRLSGADIKTILHYQTTDMGLLPCAVCQIMCQLSLVTTSAWPGWVDLGGLVTYQNGIPANVEATTDVTGRPSRQPI